MASKAGYLYYSIIIKRRLPDSICQNASFYSARMHLIDGLLYCNTIYNIYIYNKITMWFMNQSKRIGNKNTYNTNIFRQAEKNYEL